MEIIEMFTSLQGEGIHIGKPTFFVRTALCNLRCSWCVPGDALISTREEGEKRIAEVRVGEEILAYNSAEQRTRYTWVEERQIRDSSHILEIWTEGGHGLAATREHPVYTPIGWKQVGSLSLGDRIIVLDRHTGQSWARLSEIGNRTGVSSVYNLTCSPLQNFFANDILTHNCDTEYSWEKGVEMSVSEIMGEVQKQSAESVCLTGGEPLLWEDSKELIRELQKGSYEVVVETSGSISIKDVPRSNGVCISMDIKCPSSGMEGRMDFGNMELLRPGDQLKFIIADEADYEYAKDVLRKHDPSCEVVMQPEGGRRLLPLVRWVLMDGLGVRVLPQLHRLVWPERERGV
ncbi:MAG: hypothetical protein LN412_01250 [Candidatus Thermoplasmatota archaeon]|nr:hypothetical protein [Candidatus Thermoplasmatota archaeon]